MIDQKFNINIQSILNKSATKLNSSLLSEYIYDEETSSLIVKFNNSDDMYFYNLPHSVFKSFLISESKGAFFHKKIKGAYPWKKVKDIVQNAQPLS